MLKYNYYSSNNLELFYFKLKERNNKSKAKHSKETDAKSHRTHVSFCRTNKILLD